MDKYISLAHGDGGELSHRLIKDVFIEAFGDSNAALFDAAEITLSNQQIAVTTDSLSSNLSSFQAVPLVN